MLTTVLLKKNECFGQIDQNLGQYENFEYLEDMAGMRPRTEVDSLDRQTLRKIGLKALEKLIGLYVDEGRVKEVYAYVVSKYDEEWARYSRDRACGLVKVNTDDYRNYSWRGNGPKPYFEGLILEYVKKKKYRSIDDE
jgi:hypothetical protein